MRPYGSPKTLERRRRKAVELLKRGWSVSRTARRVGAARFSVWRWKRACARRGDAALAPKPASGRPARISPAKGRRLLRILIKGALAYGFPNDLWTLKRIARVVREKFGVTYHPSHIWKLLSRAGWSCQMPERRAIQRDEKAIAHWKRYQWPAIKKSAPIGRPPGFP